MSSDHTGIFPPITPPAKIEPCKWNMPIFCVAFRDFEMHLLFMGYMSTFTNRAVIARMHIFPGLQLIPVLGISNPPHFNVTRVRIWMVSEISHDLIELQCQYFLPRKILGMRFTS